MKTLVSLLLYGAAITVGCSSVVICLWGLIQFLSGLLLPLNGLFLASGR